MSFNTDPAPPIYTYNRGMTLYPEQQYANNVAYYMPRPPGQSRPGGSGGGGNTGGGMDMGLDFSQFFAPLGGNAAAGGQQLPSGHRPTTPASPMGNSRFRSRTGIAPRGWAPGGGAFNSGGGGAAVPLAGINPQVPVNTGGTSGGSTNQLAQVNSGITNGQLSTEAIQSALASLTGDLNRTYTSPMSVGGQTQSGSGSGYFGQLMQMLLPRAGSEFERTAAQQQAGMDLDFQTGRSTANLGLAALLQAVNRENTTNSIAQRNAMINNIAALLGGL